MILLRWALLIAGAVVVVIFQTSASSSFPLFNVAPQLALILLCCWAIVRPPRETLVLAPLVGIGLGLLAYQGMPESVAALAPIGLASLTWRSWKQSHVNTSVAIDWTATILLTGAATILHFAAHAIAVELSTTGVNWLDALRTVMPRNALGNMLLAAVAFWFVWFPNANHRQSSARSRSAGYS